MVKFYPKFFLTLGKAGQDTVYIKNSEGDWIEFESYEFFKVVKRQNQMYEFELILADIEASDKLIVKEFAQVLFFSENNLILKGRIQKVTYGTGYQTICKGFGMEAKTLDKELAQNSNTSASWQDSKRGQWTNISAQTIAKEILSSNTDGITPFIITPGTGGLFSTDYGNISLRFEYANRTSALAKLAESINYEWSVSQGDDYNDDFFNIATLLPSVIRATISQETFTITGANTNCYLTSQERDVNNLVNKVDVLGRGDGINQLHTSCYNASSTYSTLASDITAASTTITLIDASSFPSSGTIRIMEEQITYSGKSSNDLTGCTRGTSSTTALSHKKSVFIEKHFAIGSAEAGSSIGDNGLLDLTLTHRDVIDRETLELIGSNELLNKKDPIVRIKVTPDEPLETVGNRDIGDLITITDAESDISDDYRIVGITYRSNYGSLEMEIEASNKSLSFIEQMQKQREHNENLGKYMQGATNLYAISETDDGDANNPINIKFFVPNEAVAINKVLLNFKMKPIKTFSVIEDNDSATVSQNLTTSLATIASSSITINAKAGDKVLILFDLNSSTNQPINGTNWTRVLLQKDGSNLPTNPIISAMRVFDQNSATDKIFFEGSLSGHYLDTPGAGSFNYTLKGATSDVSTGTSPIYGTMTAMVFSTGFQQGSLSSPSVTVKVGEDGGSLTEISGSPFTSDQTEVDITSEVSDVGNGKWVNIEFTPNQNMKVEANAYVQIFLESKTT